MERFLSPEPVVKLTKSFPASYRNVIATARTCYSSKGLIADEAIDDRWDWLAQSLYQAGHHTTFQHAHFQFALDRVSRHFVWSFLHSHPFYNSEQVSQRYVTVKPGMEAIPPLSGSALRLYQETTEFLMNRYQLLCERLFPLAEREYRKRFPARSTEMKKFHAEVQKKAQEIARYVLPVSTFTYLYHTISGITLMRYSRLCQQFDTPLEQQGIVRKMVEEVLAAEPEYRTLLQESIPFEAMPETQFMRMFTDRQSQISLEFVNDFDRSLDGKNSKLIDWKNHNEGILADSVREVFGLPSSYLSDQAAIELAMDPQRNTLLGDSLNLTTLSKLSRCLAHPSYSFRKRISHTADSQDQRHRMTPASRPILATHLNEKPDYITPALIASHEGIRSLYDETMSHAWEAMNRLRNLGVAEEYVQYLLPNAVSIRFTESGDLLNLRHKYAMRLCYNAQEEIWRASVDEVEQIAEVNPVIAQFLLPPCSLRQHAGARPICPEGARYCGEKVWTYDLSDYQRMI